MMARPGITQARQPFEQEGGLKFQVQQSLDGYDTASAALALSGGPGRLIEIPVVDRSGKIQRRLIWEALIIEVYEDSRNTTLRLATSEVLYTSLAFDEIKVMLSTGA